MIVMERIPSDKRSTVEIIRFSHDGMGYIRHRTCTSAFYRPRSIPKAVSAGERAARLAEGYELRYHGCSQATLAAIMEALDIVDDGAARAAYPLGGGLGLSGEETCGALLAAVMAVGLVYGRSLDGMRRGEADMKAYSLAKVVKEEFERRVGGTRCCEIQRKLLGRCYSAWSREDMEEFERVEGHKVCASIAAEAARIAVEIIEDPDEFLGDVS